jgi:hypothetical protein
MDENVAAVNTRETERLPLEQCRSCRHQRRCEHQRPDANERAACGREIRRHGRAGAMTAGLALLLCSAVPAAGQAAPWKDCSFNDRPIPCRDSHLADGSVRLVWQDGPAMTYRLVKPGFPISILRDALGGRWEREILPQGNAVFVNPANGNRIVVPLR